MKNDFTEMKDDIEICVKVLTQALEGDDVPSFRSKEFAETFAAFNRVTAVPNSRITDFALQNIGLAAVRLLLARLVAYMQSERALSVMRGHKK